MSNADPGRARPVFQWLAQLFALMGKESKQIIRDPSSYLVAAILPMIFLLLFGYGITLDAGVMDIVILDESNSQSGLQLQENFAHSPNFRVHQARSRSEAGRMMRDSVISGFIVIPYNFEALLVGGQGKAAVAPIQVIVSGGEPNTANFIRGYSQGVIANWQQTRTPGGTIQKQPVDVAPRYWFNPAAKSRWYLVPAPPRASGNRLPCDVSGVAAETSHTPRTGLCEAPNRPPSQPGKPCLPEGARIEAGGGQSGARPSPSQSGRHTEPRPPLPPLPILQRLAIMRTYRSVTPISRATAPGALPDSSRRAIRTLEGSLRLLLGSVTRNPPNAEHSRLIRSMPMTPQSGEPSGCVRGMYVDTPPTARHSFSAPSSPMASASSA